MKQKAKIVNKLGTIIIEKSNSHLYFENFKVQMRNLKNGSTAGLNHGGALSTLWECPQGAPLCPSLCFKF